MYKCSKWVISEIKFQAELIRIKNNNYRNNKKMRTTESKQDAEKRKNILFLRLNCPCIHKICITKQNLCKYYDINEVSPILWEKFDFFLRNSSFAIYFFMGYTLQVKQREMRIFLQSYSIFSYNFCCIFSSFSFFV